MSNKNPSKTAELNSSVITKTTNKVENLSPMPIVQETRVVEYKSKRPGCLSGMGCNIAGCLVSLILLLCCLGTIFIIVNRPAFIWNGVVSFLNQGLNLPEYKDVNPAFVEESIVSNIKNGQNDVYISEDQLTAIARERLTQFRDLRFDIENGELSMFWALDNSANPVYAQVKMKTENNNIVINKIGTPNIALPEFANESANNLILSLLNLNSDGGSNNLLDSLFADGSNIKINKVEFQKDKLYLDVLINVNIFQ